MAARLGAKAEKARAIIALACSICGARNYKTTKARRPGLELLTLKKFCRDCNAHTQHIESK